MGELMGVGGLDYLKSCNKHIFVPKLLASWDAFLLLILHIGVSNVHI